MINWKNLSLNNFYKRRGWFYPLVSVFVAISISLSTILPTYAFSWIDILLQGVQVIQLSNISSRQEMKLGQRINKQLLSSRFRLSRDRQINRYINQIGQSLVTYSSRPNLKYTFQVINDNSINAYATLGGYVYVNKGLIKTAENEAELASVIAHEIGHIGAKHVVKQMRKTAIANGLVRAAGVEESQLVKIGVELAYRRPNSRRAEYQADSLGLRTLTRAGYPPSAMVSFMQKLLRKRSRVPSFLSTHPGTSARITSLTRQISRQPSSSRKGLNQAEYQARIRSIR
ncbi:MAG: M48 family metalloprotease [Richelia sp.]|nr:M48 family metalloprotease [Richelia sp.]CDN10365.1 Zn-dependent protease slr1971 [Richelia intracellularis]